MNAPMHTSSHRLFDRLWIDNGGRIEDVWRTGEQRYFHPLVAHPVRINKRRKDIPAKLLSCLSAVRRLRGVMDNAPAIPG